MRTVRRDLWRVALFGIGALTGPGLAWPLEARAQARPLTIFAAASLKGALDEIAASWAQQRGEAPPRISYAASNALARQIEQGAPADLFFSADLDWMDFVSEKGLVRPTTRVNLLANRIVLIAPRNSSAQVTLAPGVDLGGLLGAGRLAIGQVDAVPAGRYAKAALEALGAWGGVRDKLAQADNVRGALLLVARGEAPLGIVYATDAAADRDVRVIATFPETTHPPIVYPVAITRDATHPAAEAFLTYLQGAVAAEVFARHGFARPTSARPA